MLGRSKSGTPPIASRHCLECFARFGQYRPLPAYIARIAALSASRFALASMDWEDFPPRRTTLWELEDVRIESLAHRIGGTSVRAIRQSSPLMQVSFPSATAVSSATSSLSTT
jgi:hypothetical protein